MSNKPVCYCKNVTENVVIKAIKNGANTLAAIKRQTGACTGDQCETMNPKGQCCSQDIIEILRREAGEQAQTQCSCCENKGGD